jgi:hypothetical protein
MAELTDPEKHEIVSMLACFHEPKAIIAHFQSAYGLALDHKQVGRYDPTRAYYAAGDKWREIFEARRRAYLENVADVPVANQAYRLNLIQEGAEAARRMGNWKLMAELLEQAAKEVRDAGTNQKRTQIDYSGRKRVADMDTDEKRAAFAALIREALERHASGELPKLAAA